MRVAWEEFYEPHHPEDFEDWHPQPPEKYAGEVIGSYHAWGRTVLIVMLDGGSVREIEAERVRKAT